MRSRLLTVLLLTAAASACAQQPAPDIDVPTLLHQVEDHQRAAEAAQRNYLYRVTTTRTDTDSQGRPKKITTLIADSLTLRGIRVNRLISRNGRPLTVDEQKKEIDRIDKQVDKANDRIRRAAAAGKPVDPNGNDEITASRFLELGIFSNPRRLTLGGRPAIAVDFTGNPHAKTHTTGESLVRDLAGTVWIDQQDLALVRIDGHAVNDFKVGMGLLADLKKGTSFSLQNAKVNNEVWLPSQIDAQGSLRYLLFFSFTGKVRILCSDYRKFTTTSTILYVDPRQDPATQPEQPASAPPSPQP